MQEMRHWMRLVEGFQPATGDEYYHGTAARYLKTIKTNGLVPGMVRNFHDPVYAKNSDKVTFLTRDLQLALSYAENAAHIAGSKPIVLVISLPQYLRRRVRQDPAERGSCTFSLPIQPEWITKVLRY